MLNGSCPPSAAISAHSGRATASAQRRPNGETEMADALRGLASFPAPDAVPPEMWNDQRCSFPMLQTALRHYTFQNQRDSALRTKFATQQVTVLAGYTNEVRRGDELTRWSLCNSLRTGFGDPRLCSL